MAGSGSEAFGFVSGRWAMSQRAFLFSPLRRGAVQAIPSGASSQRLLNHETTMILRAARAAAR
jgi:hypothetical protein